MSIPDMALDNHYEGACDPLVCPWCRFERGEITGEELDALLDGD